MFTAILILLGSILMGVIISYPRRYRDAVPVPARWALTTAARRADRAVSAVLAVPAALAGRYGDGAAPLPSGYDPRLHRVFYPATGEIVCRERAGRGFVGFRNRVWSNARRYWGDPVREPFATMLPADWAASVEEYDWRRYMARR